MKLNVEIDCTPEEARRFLGLPDVAGMQAAVMEELQKRMLDQLSAASPEALFRAWMPMTPEQMRDAMAGMMRGFGTKPKG